MAHENDTGVSPRWRNHPLPWGALWSVLFLVGLEVLAFRTDWLWLSIRNSPAFLELPFQRQPPEALVHALALRGEAKRHEGFRGSTIVVGSSVAGYGADEEALAATLRAPAFVLWEPAADFPLAASMTDCVLRGLRPRFVVLAASPHQAVEPIDPANVARRGVYRIPHASEIGGYAECLASTTISAYRFRDPLWLFLSLRIQRLTHAFAGAPTPHPLFEFPTALAPRFGPERQAWRRTGRTRHYWQSVEPLVHTQLDPAEFAEGFQTRFRRPPHAQWEAVTQWIDCVHARGAQPVIVVFPLNMMVTRPDFAAAALGPGHAPIVPPETVAAFVADLQGIAAEHQVPFWNQVDAYPPEAFYDFHHLLPDARRRFSVRLGTWLEHTQRADGAAG